MPFPYALSTNWVHSPRPRNTSISISINGPTTQAENTTTTTTTIASARAGPDILSSHCPPPQHLTNLPPELKLMIHSTLDPVTSTCLGLSSREFYPTHRSLHKKVGLYDRGDRLPLCMYLKEWAPESYGLDWRTERFVPDKYGYGREGKAREGKRRDREREYHGGRLRRSRKYERLDVASFKWWR
ncbi:hypothetical protein LARI1_G004591 [Lachnellula arida]|uniref:F-box domain-containing protein n=1 Tax=Lachnellula arida TaxID=1316785 RepID=A0A8T9B9H7_9HELO|nr:hypothetical protein LARI1_G004591 [Lachnellula arida]